MKTYLEKLIRKESLTEKECADALFKMAEAKSAQVGAFLALYQAKGETLEEILGFIRVLKSVAKPLHLPYSVLDIVGTGGDGAGTINISTGSALLASRCGIPIIKHGNRAVSSNCGSADVLEALGFSFENPRASLEKTGFGFCFAPDFHPFLGKIREIRKELKFPTIFNLIGPLLNPAGTDHLMIGVYKKEYVPLIAEVLSRLGTKRSLVFHGYGLDELTCLGPTEALLVTQEGIEPLQIDPESLGLSLCTLSDLKGGDARENAISLGLALSGNSPLSDTLILNAAIALFLYGRVKDVKEGVAEVRKKMRKKSLKRALQPNSVIAEIKRASPSKGKIGEIPDPARRAIRYVEGGAQAISVLTHPKFEGSLQDLREVSYALKNTSIPVIRKDFIEEPLQLAEAAVHGADAVLLIATRLKERVKNMFELAKQMGLEAIVEVHHFDDLTYIQNAEIVGVNQRDLTDFSMHPEVYHQLLPHLPKNAIKVAESGIHTLEEAQRLYALGFDATLIGEALTRSPDLLKRPQCV